MPTIAELQINIDSRPIEQATKGLNDFATAADRASKAGKANQQMNEQSSSATDKAARSEENLSSMIDAQTRKLEALGQQRRKLEASGMKNTMPAEYEKLNRILDANIIKVVQQGNAVDQLNTKQSRDADKREKAALVELRIQERLAAATERRENVITRAAAMEQRQIDQTINGLSKQIKAQNEYNATIEKLNRARALGNNGSMGAQGGISGAEYESYVKLAQAQRDAALASEDNSRAITQVQNKLDTYTATLGKVERAEIEYTRAVNVLNQAQKLGLVTVEQYDQKLASFAAKRDRSITSANDNAQAEARFARELQSVLSAYDPVTRAQDQYNNSVKILSQGLQSGVISAEQFNKALTEQRIALDGVKTAQSGVRDMGGEYDSALNSLVPYRAELRNLEQQERVLRAQKEAGKVSTVDQIREYNQATEAISRNREALNKRIASGQGASLSYKQEQAALRGMPAQITDIIVSLQGGQAPLTVLLQQGGQIKDMFGGIIPALRGMSTALLAMVNPVTVIGAGLVALAAGAYSGSQELTAFNRAMIQSANASGVSASQFSMFRDQLDSTVGTAGKAAEALTMIASSGRIAGDMFTAVAEAAILMEKATGQAMSKTIEDFTAIGKDPVDAAVRLDEQYKFLTASVLAQADALVRQGKESEAVTLLQGELSSAASETATLMIEQAGYIEQAWIGVKTAVSETWDALKNIGRDSTINEEMVVLQNQLSALELRQRNNQTYLKGLGGSGIQKEIDDTKALIRQKQLRLDYDKFLGDQASKTERERRDAVAAQASAQKRYESSQKGVEKAETDLLKVRRENAKITAGGNVTDEQRTIMIANEARAVKDLADAREKANKPKGGNALDTTNIQEVKSDLSLITAEYEGYYKRVTALGEAGLVSDEATYHSQRAILEQQRKAVSESYAKQIDAIKDLQGNKKNSAAQNISLDNQLTKSEAARAVAMEKIDTKMAEIQAREKGRIEDRTRNIASYKAALDSQLESLQEEGARAVDGAGRGDNAAIVAKQLADNDRSFDKQQRQLSKSLSEGMDPVEYAEKLRSLQDTHTEMTDQILANNENLQAANQNWANGFTKAVENAAEEGRAFAKSMNSAVSGAFDSMGDALATFVTTGKLDFRSLTLSIISDMAKIAARQAASSALSSLFGMAASVAGAYFGGGANGLAAGSAGANSSATGATAGGYSDTYFPQAKGGAWDNGTKFYAQGGAFTNSIVSSPTAFSTAGGGKGVMGEAGPEAIVPLSRASDGSLGVRMTGVGGTGGGVNVYVNISGDGGADTQTDEASYQGFGKEIGDFVDSRYRALMDRDLRAGGNLRRAISEK
jgi:lambda family phage tail tape measure protein